MFREYLTQIIQRKDLSESQMADMMNTVLTGNATESQIGAMMAALATKGETFEELAGDHECGGGRDIKRMCTVTARSASIHNSRAGGLNASGISAHSLRRTG